MMWYIGCRIPQQAPNIWEDASSSLRHRQAVFTSLLLMTKLVNFVIAQLARIAWRTQWLHVWHISLFTLVNWKMLIFVQTDLFQINERLDTSQNNEWGLYNLGWLVIVLPFLVYVAVIKTLVILCYSYSFANTIKGIVILFLAKNSIHL